MFLSFFYVLCFFFYLYITLLKMCLYIYICFTYIYMLCIFESVMYIKKRNNARIKQKGTREAILTFFFQVFFRLVRGSQVLLRARMPPRHTPCCFFLTLAICSGGFHFVAKSLWKKKERKRMASNSGAKAFFFFFFLWVRPTNIFCRPCRLPQW